MSTPVTVEPGTLIFVYTVLRNGMLMGILPGPDSEELLDRLLDFAHALGRGDDPEGTVWEECDGPEGYGGIEARLPVPETGDAMTASAHWGPWMRPLTREDLRAELRAVEWNDLSSFDIAEF